MSAFSIESALEPSTQAFMAGRAGALPLYTRSPSAAHQVLTNLQSQPPTRNAR